MRCPTCGQDGLVYDDNWRQKTVLREPITNEIHPCPFPLPFSLKLEQEQELDDEYWICYHHKTPLEIYPRFRCPVSNCPQDSFIRKWYFDKLNHPQN